MENTTTTTTIYRIYERGADTGYEWEATSYKFDNKREAYEQEMRLHYLNAADAEVGCYDPRYQTEVRKETGTYDWRKEAEYGGYV